MKKLAIALAAAAALSGCSSFKLGAFCYVPASGGQCAATAVPVLNSQQDGSSGI
ncbi:hypothetical protein [Acidovorax sp. sic0104]|uniref:hypothetical protein n=1 Tax=Acidovorax sp. sic0104 TaxID=2854784 RepID=UPI001C445E7F|nr:hypothetical protein [Acidovorax sp. sic0104]MBV7539847.1 hypothetical protein [Acidovorax sp. sic0104]